MFVCAHDLEYVSDTTAYLSAKAEVEGLGRSPLWFSLSNKAWVKPSCWLYSNEQMGTKEAQWRCWESMGRWCGGYPEARCSINYLYGCISCSMHRAGLEPSHRCGCALSLAMQSFHYQSWWSHSALFPFLGMLGMHVGGFARNSLWGAFSFPGSNSWGLQR